MGVRLAFAGGALCVSLLPVLSAQTALTPTAYLSSEQARPMFEALGEPVPSVAAWPDWIAESDRATRARIALGDETSIVNLLLFGTSFTKEPRITSRQFDGKEVTAAVRARLMDFERALAQPGGNERLQFARRLLGDGGQIKARLLSMIEQAIGEGQTYARLSQEAQALKESEPGVR